MLNTMANINNELLASRTVCIILMGVLGLLILFNLYRVVRDRSKKWKSFRIIVVLVASGGLIPVHGRFQVDHSLLEDPGTTLGTLTGFCKVPLKGKGVRFRYTVKGETYTNCNTFHPYPEDSLEVPGGEYKVIYPKEYPEEGRIVF